MISIPYTYSQTEAACWGNGKYCPKMAIRWYKIILGMVQVKAQALSKMMGTVVYLELVIPSWFVLMKIQNMDNTSL